MPEQTGRPSVLGVRKRACTNCTSSKAKCSPASPNECERCRRLGKECRYASFATTRKKPERNTRLQALERKVEELVALREPQPLHLQQQTQTPAQLLDGSSSTTSPSASRESAVTSTAGNSGLSSTTISHTSSVRGRSVGKEIGDIVDRGVLTQERAQVLLDRFRTNAPQQFPFVIIPTDASLGTVRQYSPFLFLAVAAVMIFDDPNKQYRLGEEVRQQAYERILSGNEKSLDLLQGLLVYTAWYCHFYRAGKHEELLLSQLCVTLAHDLGTDKSDEKVDRLGQCRPVFNAGASPTIINARMRAYLGTYCISCLVASTVRKRVALPYTKYMERCCRSLAHAKEHYTDELIVHLVKGQELSRRIIDTFSYEDTQDDEIRGEFLVISTADAFKRDLDRLRSECPRIYPKDDIASCINKNDVSLITPNTVLDLEIQVIRVIINEAALHPDLWTRPNDSRDASEPGPLPASRIKMLWDSLDTCKGFIHTFLSFSNQDLYYLTAFFYPRLCYVFITLAKLVFLNSDAYSPGMSDEFNLRSYQTSPWDTMRVAEAADFQSLAIQVLEKVTGAVTTFGGSSGGQRSAMPNLTSAMKILLARYEQEITEVQAAWQTAQSSTLVVETARIHASEAVDYDANFSAQGVGYNPQGVGYNPQGVFDVPFGWDFLASVNWEDTLEAFA